MFSSTESAQRALGPKWVWPNFRIEELACRCGYRFCKRRYWHAPRFLTRLQKLRDEIGQPLIVTSGHRCPQWNALIGGAPLSRHKTMAVDISLRGLDPNRLRSIAAEVGFSGFGLARNFLHLDTRERRADWYYPGSLELWQT